MGRTIATFACNLKYFSVIKYKAVATEFCLCKPLLWFCSLILYPSLTNSVVMAQKTQVMTISVFFVLCRPCLCSVGSSQAAIAAAVCAAAVIVAVGSVNRNLPKARSRNSTSLQRIWRHSCSQMKGVGENAVSCLG